MKTEWHEIKRNMQTLTGDEIITMSPDVAPKLNGMTLLIVRYGKQPPRTFINGDGDDLRQVGRQAGFTVEDLAEGEYPDLPGSACRAAHALIPWSARLDRTSTIEKIRTDIGQIRKGVEASIPEDGYASVTFKKRNPIEDGRIRNWVASEQNFQEDSNDLIQAGSMECRVTVGCNDMRTAKDAAQAVGRAVFRDLNVMSSHASRPGVGLPVASAMATLLSLLAVAVNPLPVRSAILLSTLAVAVLLVATVFDAIAHSYVFPPVSGIAGVVVAAAWASALLAIPAWIPLIPLTAFILSLIRWRMVDTLWTDILQRPRFYWMLAPKRAATSADNETHDGHNEDRKSVVAYGAQRTTLQIAARSVIALILPAANASAVKQDLHPVPEILTRSGILIGRDQTGRDCHLDPGQLPGGIAISGEQGSGKSVLVRGITQWATLNRASTTSDVWGADSRIIDFAMKDDEGVDIMQRFRREHRLPPAVAFYIADPDSRHGIDIIGIHSGKDAKMLAEGVAAAMQYSYEDGDIRNESLDVIAGAMTIGIAAWRYERGMRRIAERDGDASYEGDLVRRARRLEQSIPGAGMVTEQRTPVGWAAMALTAADGQCGAARALGRAIGAAAQELAEGRWGGSAIARDMLQAKRACEQLYGLMKDGRPTVSDQQLLQRTSASKNKVKQLMQCEWLFDPLHADVRWRDILDRPGDYHVVFAPRNGRQLPSRMVPILGAWALYTLWDSICEQCQGWQRQGRHTMLVCDELSMLARADAQVLEATHEQGRAFGVINVFATQHPDQLAKVGLFTSFMGYSTFVSFANKDPQTGELTAQRLTADKGGDGWTQGAIRGLEKYTVGVSTQTSDGIQPSFLCRVKYFDEGLIS